MAQDQAVGTTGTPVTRDAAGSVRRHELAAFLRHRREHITPEQVGLPRGRRRRTPGLRREEVAHLAAVGVTWYTWLEQARDIQVSVQVLDALARTLLLDPSERAHLFQLAGQVDPTPATSCPSITPALRAVLEQLEPVPACVQNSRYDILAYNRTYGMLLCDLDAVPPEDRNCMILSYTHDEWRSSIVHLQDAQRLMAARFRATMAGHLADPAWKMLLKRLRASPRTSARSGTATRWWRHRTSASSSTIATSAASPWTTPICGWVLSRARRIVTYAPADEESRERLERLHQIALGKGASRASQPA